MEEIRHEETEPFTLLLLRAYVRLSTEIFRKTLQFPELHGEIFRGQVYSCMENLTKAHRALVSERKESRKALRAVEDFQDYIEQQLTEKYGPLGSCRHG